MDILYADEAVLVCVKPAGVLSTDEPGGMPDLVRQALGEAAGDIRTVHRLDRVVGGLMVLARSAADASELSRQIREDGFEKEYLAVVHGCPEREKGTYTDLLLRDKRECKTYVATQPGKGVQEAALDYAVLASRDGLTRVKIRLRTGRTHQIRVQFSSRGMPLAGDRKYGLLSDECDIALWSCRLCFRHPRSGRPMEFRLDPPARYPWTAV